MDMNEEISLNESEATANPQSQSEDFKEVLDTVTDKVVEIAREYSIIRRINKASKENKEKLLHSERDFTEAHEMIDDFVKSTNKLEAKIASMKLSLAKVEEERKVQKSKMCEMDDEEASGSASSQHDNYSLFRLKKELRKMRHDLKKCKSLLKASGEHSKKKRHNNKH